jgi:hypothetical protein
MSRANTYIQGRLNQDFRTCKAAGALLSQCSSVKHVPRSNRLVAAALLKYQGCQVLTPQLSPHMCLYHYRSEY